MFSGAGQHKKSIFKNPLFYSSVVLAVAVLATAWTVFSRWYRSREWETRAKRAQQERRRENDARALEQFGGTKLAIQDFYATAAVVERGQTVQLCYGVANATTVRLEPQSNPVWPSYSRCVDVTPDKTTAYTLTVTDAAGNAKSQTLEIQVR